MQHSVSIFFMLCLILVPSPSIAKSGTPFNLITDIHWSEIDFTIEGVCFCPRVWGVEIGLIVSYWEPFLLLDTGVGRY